MILARPRSLLFWLGWHLLAIVAIVVVPYDLRSSGIVSTGRTLWWFAAAMAVAYALMVIVLTAVSARGARVRFFDLVCAAGIGYGAVFLLLLLAKLDYPRPDLVVAVALGGAFALLSVALPAFLQKAALALAAVVVAASAAPWLIRASTDSPPTSTNTETKLVRTIFHNLVVRSGRRFAMEDVTGGGIEQFGDHYLLATGSGRLFSVTWDADTRSLDTRLLQHRVPLNRDEYVADTPGDPISAGFFRVGDILVRDSGETFRLFASHEHWDTQNKCYTVRISETSGRYDAFESARDPAVWKTVYETAPCLGLKPFGDRFAGFQMGGRMASLDDRTLLITVGDHAFDGVEDKRILPQDETAAYGKIIAVDLETGVAVIYSSGHRNPQGLSIDAGGAIWETEHAPRGGDELNLISRGRNYGWPRVTLGTNYNQPLWPLNASQGRHEGFEAPIYAWLPSIGISNLISVRGSRFERWQGDLLVSALNDSSIWRVRVTDGRVLFAERIEIGQRIRDIMQDRDGRLVLWTEDQRVPPTYVSIVIIDEATDARALEGLTSAQRGELVFSQCDGCHRIYDGRFHAIGPDLFGIVGKNTAAGEGFGYSQALLGLSTTWTDENLDRFIENPQQFAPGTTMAFPGISDPETRAEIIEYIKAVPPPE